MRERKTRSLRPGESAENGLKSFRLELNAFKLFQLELRSTLHFICQIEFGRSSDEDWTRTQSLQEPETYWQGVSATASGTTSGSASPEPVEPRLELELEAVGSTDVDSADNHKEVPVSSEAFSSSNLKLKTSPPTSRNRVLLNTWLQITPFLVSGKKSPRLEGEPIE